MGMRLYLPIVIELLDCVSLREREGQIMCIRVVDETVNDRETADRGELCLNQVRMGVRVKMDGVLNRYFVYGGCS